MIKVINSANSSNTQIRRGFLEDSTPGPQIQLRLDAELSISNNDESNA
jgi:hypothetical protein